MHGSRKVSLADLANLQENTADPGDFENLAAGARPTLKDLVECLSFSPGDGRIWLNDQRMLLLHGNAFGSLRRELIDGLGIERARGLFTRMGYLCGARDARMERERWPDGDLTALYTAQLHSLEGMVKVEPVRFKFDPRQGLFDGEYLWHHSLEADEHIAAYGLGTAPVCWMLTGYATGHGSTLLGHLLIAREVGCRATGAACCRLVARSPALWGDIEEDLRYLNVEGIAAIAQDRPGEQKAAPVTVGAPAARATVSPYDDGIVGASAAYTAASHYIQRVAATDATVLFTGESGVGKEIFAKTLHRISNRAEGPFIAVNCAAIPESLTESELFGVERGAYTGAAASRPGRFERANGGTLFLDEIGTLSLVAQGKLLRSLQEGQIERVGGTRSIAVDVRVVAATNLDLRQATRDGTFREDLYYRLNVYPVHLPPLRERRDDIPLLLNHFLNHYCAKYGAKINGFTQRAIKTMLTYAFPGNIRELQNLVERGVISADDGGLIDLPHMFTSGEALPENVLSVALGVGTLADTSAGPPAALRPNLRELLAEWQGTRDEVISLAAIERALVEDAVTRSAGNLSAAARLLGMTRTQIAYRCSKYAAEEKRRGQRG
ncbi:MAG: sigma 54-interacting transcriptional regulator [Gammaproteobacteria bacterium]|nr:sigma 54-interacting transcriptional regulator [Gammaproteobacteria bacterium]